MPRVRMRTTNREKHSNEMIREAIRRIEEEKFSYSDVSIELGIPKSSIARYVKQHKENPTRTNYAQNNDHSKMFTHQEEVMLAEYIRTRCKMCYGMSCAEVRALAFEFGQINNKPMMQSWFDNQQAGKEWLLSFMKRHKLTLRTPQQLSLSRATSFNRHTVSLFFDNYKEVRLKYKFAARDIYNLDECGIQTVHKLSKVITDIGDKFVAKMTSAERGSLVTMVNVIGATGKAVPPFLIFPRVKFDDSKMLKNAFEGTWEAANPSGWINSDIFLDVMKHFVKNERPSKENPALIILDNHESHINLPAINYCRENGIVLLTLPPHSSHKMQPLDVAVYFPFKTQFNSASSTWMVNNPGKAISIMEMAELAGKAFKKAFNPSNITSGFSRSGLQPFDDQTFTDADFKPSTITDRPAPTTAAPTTEAQPQSSPTAEQQIQSPQSNPQPSSSTGIEADPNHALVASSSSDNPAVPTHASNSTLPVDTVDELVAESLRIDKSVELCLNMVLQSDVVQTNASSLPSTPPKDVNTNEPKTITPPEVVCPYPKAKPRKNPGNGRKKGKSMILTSTPVKNSIEAEIERKRAVEQAKQDRKKAMLEKRAVKEKEKEEKRLKKEEKAKKREAEKNIAMKTRKRRKVQKSKSTESELSSSSESDSRNVDEKTLCASSNSSEDEYEDKNDNTECVICGEVGYGRQLWFRCISCGKWAHEKCSGWDSPVDYVCDFCA